MTVFELAKQCYPERSSTEVRRLIESGSFHLYYRDGESYRHEVVTNKQASPHIPDIVRMGKRDWKKVRCVKEFYELKEIKRMLEEYPDRYEVSDHVSTLLQKKDSASW